MSVRYFYNDSLPLPAFCEDCGKPVKGAKTFCRHFREVIETRISIERQNRKLKRDCPYPVGSMDWTVYVRGTDAKIYKRRRSINDGFVVLGSFPALRGTYHGIAQKYELERRGSFFVRDWANLILNRIAKSRYVSERLVERVMTHCRIKHGIDAARRDAQQPLQRNLHISSDGPFCPIDVDTSEPAHAGFCYICGSLSGVAVLEADVYMQDHWMTLRGSEDAPNVCANKRCREAEAWRRSDRKHPMHRQWSAYRRLGVKGNKKNIYQAPAEWQGVETVRAYLRFIADGRSRETKH
jgi:hypothetical protein